MVISPVMHWVLMILGLVGSTAAYTVISRLMTPPAPIAATDITQIAAKEIGVGGAFSGLKPDGSLFDKLDLFLVKTFHLDVKLEDWHMLLGRPAKPTPLAMLHWKEAAALLCAVLALVGTGSPIGFLVAGPIGFFLPDVLFQRRIRARQEDMMRKFPTVVDLEALTIEAGLDYMAAFERILKSTEDKSEFEKELSKMIDELALGYSRKEALKRLASRTGLQEIRSFVGLIIQSDELGTSLVDLLRNYAADMRFRRLQKVEKLAAQASTKMLIPLFIFIFPTVFIMMLAPMIKSLIAGGLGF